MIREDGMQYLRTSGRISSLFFSAFEKSVMKNAIMDTEMNA